MAAQLTNAADLAAEERAKRRAHLQVVRDSDALMVDERAGKKGKGAELKARFEAKKVEYERHAWFRVLETVAIGFKKDRVTENAAAMTYYGIFSLFPLFLLFMSVAGLVMSNNQAAQEQILNL